MKSKEALEKISTKQVAIELFNIVSNGKYDMNEIVPYFDCIDKALTELEELKQEVIDRQETEDSLTKWVSELTDEIDELKFKLMEVGKEE